MNVVILRSLVAVENWLSKCKYIVRNVQSSEIIDTANVMVLGE